MTDEKQNKRIKNILNSRFTLPILGGIWSGKRPTQIAQSLKISPQALNYYIANLIEVDLICKDKDRNGGLVWRPTPRGSLFLKEKFTRSVNNSRYGAIPFRLHSVTFSFKINSMPEDLNLNWISMNNGVTKCVMKFKDHTEEFMKSPNEQGSVLLIHLPHTYSYEPYKAVLKQYDVARYFSALTAQRLNLTIAETGHLINRPHIAFEHDVIAMFLANFETAEVATEGGISKAWIDSSTGNGELETNDPDYAYDYLKMPQIVIDIWKAAGRIELKTAAGWRGFYDPTLTENN
jgi:hypothetical protein